MSPSLSIVIPCLNEGKNVATTYAEVVAALGQIRIDDYEILYIDDGSTDGTFAEIEKLSLRDPKVRAIRNEKNLGLGGSYKKGRELAGKEYYMLVTGDNAWPADGLADILKLIGQADLVIPYLSDMQDKGPARKFLSRGFVAFVNVLFGFNLKYYNGLVIHRLQDVRQIKIVTDSFAYQAETLVKALKRGRSYVQVGARTTARADGKSKALHLDNVVSVFLCMIGLRLKAFLYGAELYKH